MRIDTLSPAEGARKEARRLGRGIGSGLGKTSGKGHKGAFGRRRTSRLRGRSDAPCKTYSQARLP